MAGGTRSDAEGKWILVGAPLDCSGTDRGEARAPGALRAANLAQRVGAEDLGDVDAVIDDPSRDPETGVIGFEQIREASSRIRCAVGDVLDGGEGRPLVLGGDCTVLVGALAAARQRFGRVGLAFLDGHVDYFGGDTSPSGEAADMDLALVTGYGPTSLVDLAGEPPIVEPGDVVVMGHRADLDDDTRQEVALVDERIQLLEARAIRRGDPERLGRNVAQRLEVKAGRVWLHFDADVFDEGEMPAVTYPQPDGLSWDQLGDLLRPITSSPALVGVSVADYVPDKDSDGHHARRLVDLVGGLLARRKEHT